MKTHVLFQKILKSCHLRENYKKYGRTAETKESAEAGIVILVHIDVIFVSGDWDKT
jgi:hypothetical protein